MSVSKFLRKNLTTFSRNARKGRVIKDTYDKEQFNNDVVNIHRMDQGNVGDFYCAPHLYFDELKNKSVDIFDFKSNNKKIINEWMNSIAQNSLIIGGGGLLNRGSFEKQMKLYESLSKKGKKTIIWGAGHNSKSSNDFRKNLKYNIDISKFSIVGTRDYASQGDWVPCVSCMHPVFDKNEVPTQEIGVIFHKKTLKNKKLLKKLDAYPNTSNTTDLNSLVSFIKKSEIIVTDSYHAMYWSMLLDRKVMVIPNSSKFYDFKYQPIITEFEDFEKNISRAQNFTGVLEECREVNRKFADKVFDYLKL